MSSASAAASKPFSPGHSPDRTLSTQAGSLMRARLTVIKSNSSRYIRSTSLSWPTLVEPTLLNAPMTSPDKPTGPTLIVAAPVSFLAQPAKLSPSVRSISGNSGS